jgi:hypothetical protein
MSTGALINRDPASVRVFVPEKGGLPVNCSDFKVDQLYNQLVGQQR